MNKISKVLTISVLSLVAVLGLALAQTDTASIDSTIASSTAIDISPNNFSWNSSTIGLLNPAYRSAEIENIGSTNITGVSLDVTITEPGSYGSSITPHGNGVANNLKSGDFLMIGSGNTTFGYIMTALQNRSSPVYVQANGSSFFSTIDFGGYQYYVMVAQGNGSGSSTCANGTLHLNNATAEAHNRTQTGNVSLSSKTGIALSSNALLNATGTAGTAQNGSWGIADVSFNMPTASYNTTYCIAIANNCSAGRIWKYNNNIEPYDNNSLCSNDAFFYNDSGSGGGFKPGAMTRLYLTTSVGLGYPNGTIGSSVLTVRATD